MNLLQLGWKNVLDRKGSSGLTVLLVALGVGLAIVVTRINAQVEQNVVSNSGGIDMVLGAKGSPLQIILSTVLHVDAPTGNIQKAEADKIAAHPLVKQSVPILIGDNHKGYRIVGTTSDYLELYNGELQEGKPWENNFEVVIGAEVYQRLQLKVGDTFSSTHGLSEAGKGHDHAHFVVRGILKESRSVLDRLILTAPESIWAMHHGEGQDQITALLVEFKSPMGMLQLPRQVNQSTNLQAALPSIEINRLFSLFGAGKDVLLGLAGLILLVSGISVFISLYTSLKDRIQEMALLRVHGASGFQLLQLVLFEGITVATIGYGLGLVISRLGLLVFAATIEQQYHFQFSMGEFSSAELYLFVAALGLGILAGLVPGIQAMRVNIADELR